jgi:hypothetical protein
LGGEGGFASWVQGLPWGVLIPFIFEGVQWAVFTKKGFASPAKAVVDIAAESNLGMYSYRRMTYAAYACICNFQPTNFSNAIAEKYLWVVSLM